MIFTDFWCRNNIFPEQSKCFICCLWLKLLWLENDKSLKGIEEKNWLKWKTKISILGKT